MFHDLLSNSTADALSDLYRFETSTMTWTNVSALAVGQVPNQRYGHCFVSDESQFYVFGGKDSKGKPKIQWILVCSIGSMLFYQEGCSTTCSSYHLTNLLGRTLQIFSWAMLLHLDGGPVA